MITSLKDSEGKIITFCEWRLVGKSGFDKVNGEYVWVEELWVHPSCERKMQINRIIDEIMRIAKTAEYCYFKRNKYNGRIKMIKKEYWERRRRSYSPVLMEV